MTAETTSTDTIKAERVTQSVSEYRAMKWQLEEELKQVVRDKLAVKQAEIDGLVRVMYDADPKHNKAAVARALMTSDRATVDRILARTEGVVAVAFELDAPVEQDTNGMWFDAAATQLKVKLNGQWATFDVETWPENGEIVLTSHESLWNKDYSVRNEVVYALDAVDVTQADTELRQSVANFLKGKL